MRSKHLNKLYLQAAESLLVLTENVEMVINMD